MAIHIKKTLNSDSLAVYVHCLYVVGEVLSVIDTRQMNNSFASISPCGKFVASAGRNTQIFKHWILQSIHFSLMRNGKKMTNGAFFVLYAP